MLDPRRLRTDLDAVKAGLARRGLDLSDIERAAALRPAVLAQSAHWVEFVGLADVAHSDIGSLTLLQRKLLELARALACRPRVLFLDEVLTGLNPRELAHGIDLIRRIRASGISIVVVEHIMRVIRDLCSEVTVLNFGRVIASGRTGDCLSDTKVVEAYLGHADA